MTSKPLWRFSLRVDDPAETVVGEILERVLGTSPSLYTDLKSGITRLSAYLQGARSEMELQRLRLRAALQELRANGPAIPPPRIALSRIRHEDWAESWKRHFKPMEVSRRLLIRPSWSNKKARQGQRVLVLDPGLSFGTGQHPTTAFCLAQVDVASQTTPGFSFLDVGTGSGILALAAARLGAARVDAFDFDPVAVRVARANARRNRLLPAVSLQRRDIATLQPKGRRYDLVCANLTADLLEKHLERLVARLKPEGVLVLAGILHTQFPVIRQISERLGLRLVRTVRGGEWRSGSFRRTP